MISVIMLTYNREIMVSRAIESILVQSFSEFEFIIIDNGSSDRSGCIADEYAQKDSRIRVIHRERGNIGSGRNAGLDAATGEYIAFIDDDDWCEPDYLEFLYILLTKNGADVSICGAADKVYNEKCVMIAEEALIELMRRRKYNVAFPAKLFKASLFDGTRFSETSRYDDIELMPLIFSKADRIAYHGLPKYTFERHENNNSAWTIKHTLLDSATLEEYLSVYKKRTEWLCAQFPESIPAWRYFEWSFMISMTEKIHRLKITDCNLQLEAMTKELLINCEEFLRCKFLMDFEKDWMEKYICRRLINE